MWGPGRGQVLFDAHNATSDAVRAKDLRVIRCEREHAGLVVRTAGVYHRMSLLRLANDPLPHQAAARGRARDHQRPGRAARHQGALLARRLARGRAALGQIGQTLHRHLRRRRRGQADRLQHRSLRPVRESLRRREGTARPHGRSAAPPTHFIPDPRTCSVARFLRRPDAPRPCVEGLAGQGHDELQRLGTLRDLRGGRAVHRAHLLG